MRFVMECPLHSDGDGEWVNPDNIIKFAQAIEAAGFDGLAFTDHPAPSAKWLQNGGHETFDPFAALTFVAAATSRIRLVTHLIVVPYRNPLLMARSMTTVDALSKGRATFALGTGYLRSEFAALGVEMDERNALFDEAIEVLTKVWTREPVSFDGMHFKATGQIFRPSHVQEPHPPLWVGGNSTLTLRRVAKWAQGWAPMVGPARLASTTRTAAIETMDDLVSRLGELEALLEQNGRSLSDIDINASAPGGAGSPEANLSTQQRLDELHAMEKIGVTWVGVHVPRGDHSRSIEKLQQFAAEVIAPGQNDDRRDVSGLAPTAY